MLRLLLIILFLISSIIPGFSAEQWLVGRPLSGDNPVNYPAAALANNDSLDRMVANYRQGMSLIYVNASSLSVAAGSVVCVDSSVVHYLRQNTSSTTLNSGNIDIGGSFSSSTTYYVYANCSANATTATFTISASSSTPTGPTAYRLIGSFATDGSANILPASLNQEASGYVTADTNGNKEIQGVFNYAGNTSSPSFVTGNLKIAYGQSNGLSGNSSETITGLPFTSGSTYSVSTGQYSSFNCAVSSKSGSQFTITNTHNDASGGNGNCDWIAIGI